MVGHPEAAWYAAAWAPYTKYASIDKLYGLEGYAAHVNGHEGFNPAQSVMNLVEATLQTVALGLEYNQHHHAAHVVAAVVLPMTLGKTALYFLTEAFTGWAHVKHVSDPVDFWFFYVFMNGLWIVVPLWALLRVFIRLVTVG